VKNNKVLWITSIADVIDTQQNDYSLYKQGALSDIIDDPASSDGKAAYIVDNKRMGDFITSRKIYGIRNAHKMASLCSGPRGY